MASTDDIFRLLMNADTQNQQTSPYQGSLQAIGEGQQVLDPLARDPYTGALRQKPLQALGTGAALGIAKGIAQGLQDQYVAKENQKAQQVFKSVLAGQNPEMPQGMNPSIFSGIQNLGSIFQIQQQQQAAAQKAALNKEAVGTLLKARPDLIPGYLKTGQIDAASGELTPSGFKADFLQSHKIDPTAPTKQVEFQLKEEASGDKAKDPAIAAKSGMENIDRLINMVDQLPDSGVERAVEGVLPITNKTNFFDQQAKSQAAALAKQMEGRVNDATLKAYVDSMTRHNGDTKEDLKQRLVNSQLWLSRIAQGDTKALEMDPAEFALSRGINPESIGIVSPFKTSVADRASGGGLPGGSREDSLLRDLGVTTNAPSNALGMPPPGLSFQEFQAWKKAQSK